MNEITDLSSLNIPENILLDNINMETLCTFHFTSNLYLQVDLYFFVKKSFVGEQIDALIKIVVVSKLGISKGSYLGFFVAANNDELLI